jgi:hypothetical protein
MNKQDIINLVGLAEYKLAARLLRQDSARPDYGKISSGVGMDCKLPHDIADAIWESEGSWRDLIVLFFSIYDDMPAYGHLMHCAIHCYPDLSESDRDFWWEQVCDRLNGDDLAIKQPLLYSLWCDYFEISRNVAQAWEAMVYSKHATPKLMQTILPYSGPVPYSLKRYLYRELVLNPSFHQAIFDSLTGSFIDVYGSIEKYDALDILSRLELPSELSEARSYLEEKLKEDN